MVKSATASVIKESSKLDLHQWLSGGRIRTKTVQISNDPDLAERVDAVAVQMNDIADQINAAAEDEPAGGIADDDPVEVLRAQWDTLKAEYDALEADYEASLMSFTFRSEKFTDEDDVVAALVEAGVKDTPVNRGIALVALRAVDPVLTYQGLVDLLDVVGADAYMPMLEAVTALRSRKEPTAPLLLRP